MSSIKTLNSVNEFSSKYDDYIKNCHWFGADILFGLMYDFIKPNQTILDIGIGTGLTSRPFIQFGLSVFGVDGAENMIAICRDKGIAKELKKADLTKDETWFENKTFDNAISHGVFHLIGDLTHVFNQTSLSLKKNGCFGFTYEGVGSSDDNYKESPVPGIFERENMPSGIKVFRHTDGYIFKLMEVNGFEMVKKTEFLAFVDPNSNTKTYFNVVVAKKM